MGCSWILTVGIQSLQVDLSMGCSWILTVGIQSGSSFNQIDLLCAI